MDEIEKLIRRLSVKLEVAEQQLTAFETEFNRLREALKDEPEFVPNVQMADVVIAVLKRLRAQVPVPGGRDPVAVPQ